VCIIDIVNELLQLRKIVGSEVFDYGVLTDALRAYQKPADRVRRMVDEGEIVRVKRGLYVFGEPVRRKPIVREYLANLIYGPSYVSLESALSFHGLIPERVEAMTSVVMGRSHLFETPFGTFSYQGLTKKRYAVGTRFETLSDARFLIASAEKALVDKVWTDKRFNGTTVRDFSVYLFEDLRLDDDALHSFNLDRLDMIGRAYNSPKISNLIRFVAREKRHANE